MLLSSLPDQGKFYWMPVLISVPLILWGNCSCASFSAFSPKPVGRGAAEICFLEETPLGSSLPNLSQTRTQSSQWNSLGLLKVVVLPYCPPPSLQIFRFLSDQMWSQLVMKSGSYVRTKLFKVSCRYYFFWFIMWNWLILGIYLKPTKRKKKKQEKAVSSIHTFIVLQDLWRKIE